MVDDGSTDDGAAVVRGFADPRIRLIQQENQGVSAARNRGIEAARAEIVAFLDADDEWLPGFLTIILRLRYKYPNAGAYATAYMLHKRNGQRITANIREVPPSPWAGPLVRYFKTVTQGHPPVSASSVVIPKNVICNIGGFLVGQLWGEDVDLWGKIALKYDIIFSWEIGAVYHLEATNRAQNRRTCVDSHPFLKTAKEVIESGAISDLTYSDLLLYIEFLELSAAANNIMAGNSEKARIIISGIKTSQYKWKRTYL